MKISYTVIIESEFSEDHITRDQVRDLGWMEKESWYLDGRLHADLRPAVKILDSSGGVAIEKWFDNGVLHRSDDGSSFRQYDEDTRVVIEERWYREGRLHAEHGPAVITRHPETGQETGRLYYRYGVVQPAPEPSVNQDEPHLG